MLRLIAILITILLMTSGFQIQKSFSENAYCKYDDVSLNSEYKIINGKLNAICIDKDGLAITVFLIPEEEGILTLTIPRSSLDIRNSDCTDKKFSIEGDKDQVEFNELKETNDSRKFEIHFTPQSVKENFVMTTDVSVGHTYKMGFECSSQINYEKENIQSPLTQIKNGVKLTDVVCNKDLVLLISPNNRPACVHHSTFEILKQRGWIVNITYNSDIKSVINLPEIKEPAKNIVDANNKFMLDYYSITNTREDNSFFSPWSILSAFSVLNEGARGQTADEISNVFYLPKDDSERRDSFRTMQNNLNVNGSGYELRNANALWIQQGFDVKNEFVNISNQYYDSQVSKVNFPTDEPIIDSWIEEKTNNKIKDLVKDQTTENTALVITNAVYFKGTWQTQFNPSQTRDHDFRVNEDKLVSIPMMSMQSKFPYTETEDLQILSMSYKGQRMSMLVLLPKNNLESLEKSITIEKLEEWKNNLQEQEIKISMPKFKFETKYELSEIIKEMGIKLAFDKYNADLSGIANIPPRLFVSTAIHKAFVDVNEEGAEAAAATGITINWEGEGPKLPVFNADHPFIFLIQDNETGLILFMGKVYDPTK